MAGRKQRGRGRGQDRGYLDGGFDRGRGRDSRGRGRGRGRGGPGYAADINSGRQTPVQDTTFSRGSGFRYDRGWRVGHISPDPSTERAPRRHPGSNVRRGEVSLSQQLYEDRPFFKPIAFVPSRLPSLFLNQDEIFKPMTEEAGEKEAGHAPTADRVLQIFHRSNLNPNSSDTPSGAELPEIDFMDLGRIMNEIEVLEVGPASSKNATCTSIDMAENHTTTKTVEESFMRDRIDIKSSPVQNSLAPADLVPVERRDARIQGGDVEDDDEIIVYVAPNPRKGIHLSNSIPSSSAAVATILPFTDREPVSGQVLQGTNDPRSATTFPAERTLEYISTPSPIHSPSLTSRDVSNAVLSGSPNSTRRARRPRRVSKKRVRRHVTFGSLGAIRAETALRDVHPRRDDQRRGDSDVDWGGSTSEASLEDGGMLVDHDVDVHTMEAFVKGMNNEGSAQVTANDSEDEAEIHAENEDEKESDGESELESGGNADQDDEQLELASIIQIVLTSDEGDIAVEHDLVDSEDEDTSEEEESPKGSFQARLERLRKQTQGRSIRDVLKDELDGELEVEEEDSIVAQIQEFLDDNDEILRAQDGKQRNRIFQAINHGKLEFEIDFADSPARRKKKKFIPAELREQWERDRAKKAERKRLRELERAAAALDRFGTGKGSKKKKARSARPADALASPMSLEAVVGLMRRFVADIGGARTHALPPMGQEMRKTVHELAHAFKLKSKSESNGAARFTTLIKTTRSDVNINEKKIARILRQPSSYVTHEGGKAKSRAGRIRPRDGEVVGEAAPKLDGSNIGFQMLSAMGWEEGGRIGAVGGLEAPLMAVIKTTKLGLGASASRSSS